MSELPQDEANCPVCLHSYRRQELTRHHLVPKSRKGRETVLLCRNCHRQIHTLFSEKELERQYGTLTQLLATDEMQQWCDWIRRRKPSSRIAMNRSTRRR